jgi:acetyl-CoA carboxylase / biotin carboxylase 1
LHADSARPDWAHIFLSALPTLPLGSPADEAAVISALKAGAARLIAKYSTMLRKAAVAQWEVRLRVTDNSGSWRLVASSPTGKSGQYVGRSVFTVGGHVDVQCARHC